MLLEDASEPSFSPFQVFGISCQRKVVGALDSLVYSISSFTYDLMDTFVATLFTDLTFWG